MSGTKFIPQRVENSSFVTIFDSLRLGPTSKGRPSVVTRKVSFHKHFDADQDGPASNACCRSGGSSGGIARHVRGASALGSPPARRCRHRQGCAEHRGRLQQGSRRRACGQRHAHSAHQGRRRGPLAPINEQAFAYAISSLLRATRLLIVQSACGESPSGTVSSVSSQPTNSASSRSPAMRWLRPRSTRHGFMTGRVIISMREMKHVTDA